MSLNLLVGLVVVCAAPAARADGRAVLAEVAATAPFNASQLTDAIRIRMPAGGAPIRVRVFATPGGVRVEARGNAREVALGGLTGAAAARLVALAASDLLLDDLASAPLEPPAASIAAQVAPARARMTFSAVGGAAAWPYALGGFGVDAVASTGRWLVAAEAGGSTLVGGPLRLMAAIVRLGGGARYDILEVRATATFAPLIVGNGTGDWTILPGVGVSARLRFPIAPALRAVLAAGVDVFAVRTEYLVEGMSVLTTPRGSPWVAAGLEVAR